MPSEQAWKDLRKIEAAVKGVRGHVRGFRDQFRALEELRQLSEAKAERRAPLKELMDLHPTLSKECLDAEYAKYRVLYDWLNENKL